MGSVRPQSHWKAKRKAQMAGKIISAPKSILLTFFRLSCGPDLTCVRSVLQWIFLDAFLGGTSESPARPARYSPVLKVGRGTNDGTSSTPQKFTIRSSPNSRAKSGALPPRAFRSEERRV